MLGSEAGDNHRAPSATHSGPVSLVWGASRNAEPNGVEGPIKPPAATRMALRTISGWSAAKQRAMAISKGVTEDMRRPALQHRKYPGHVRGKIVKRSGIQPPPAVSNAAHVDSDDLCGRCEALSKVFQIAGAAAGVREQHKRIARSINGAFDARRTNIYYLSLRHLDLWSFVRAEVLCLGYT